MARLASGYDAVGIDEIQFFDDGIVEAIGALVARGARVVAAGLAQDFRGMPFGSMPTLLCVAEFVDKLEAVCHRCGGPATLTQRLVDGRPAPFGGATVQIGALDSYEARCRACYEPGVDAQPAAAWSEPDAQRLAVELDRAAESLDGGRARRCAPASLVVEAGPRRDEGVERVARVVGSTRRGTPSAASSRVARRSS